MCKPARARPAPRPPAEPCASLPQDLATLDVAALTPLSPQVISRQATINIGAPAGVGPRRRRTGPRARHAIAQRRGRPSAAARRAAAPARCRVLPCQPRRLLPRQPCRRRAAPGAAGCSQGRSTAVPPAAAAGTIGHVAHGKSTVVKAISGVQTVRFKNELERNITIKLGYANAKIYKCADPSCPRPACYKAYGSTKEDRPKCDVPGAHSRPAGGGQAAAGRQEQRVCERRGVRC